MARSIDSQRNLWFNGIWVAAFLLTGPIIAAVSVVLGMYRSFETIDRMKAPRPEDLAIDVRANMLHMTIGAVMGLFGAALLILCLIKFNRLKRAELDGPKDDEPKW
jgi:hypothetical protein